jgi:hypothetical protein
MGFVKVDMVVLTGGMLRGFVIAEMVDGDVVDVAVRVLDLVVHVLVLDGINADVDDVVVVVDAEGIPSHKTVEDGVVVELVVAFVSIELYQNR